MDGAHHLRLLVGYGVATLAWYLLARRALALWPGTERLRVERPWWELLWLALAITGVIGLGQLYQAGIRLPSDGPLGPVLEALNQVAIFAPLWLLLFRSGHGLSSAWLPTSHVPLRLSIGVGLALLALLSFLIAGGAIDRLPEVLESIVSYRHVDELTQVALEDLGIAMVLVRLGALMGPWRAVVLTAALFAAAHIPAQLSQDATPGDLIWLLPDVGLALLVLTAVTRARDIWWFWPIHTAMDLMQFGHVFGASS